MPFSSAAENGSREPPRLQTDRLVLRAHLASDFEACAAMWADPVVVRYTIGSPSTPQRSWQRILMYRGLWAMLGFGYWAVEEKASGRFIGEVGFADFKREIQPSIHGVPELGWALVASAHGKGYATEALRAAVAWGDSRFRDARTVCIIHRDNAVSLRVAEKLGFRERLKTPTDDAPDCLLARSPA